MNKLNSPIPKLLFFIFFMAILGTTSSCLKTRAQLKENGSDPDEQLASQPTPIQIKEVQPHGQYVLDEIKSEITRLTGRIEDLERNNQDQKSSNPIEDLKKIETRIVELEQAQASMLEAIQKLQSSGTLTDSVGSFEKGKNLFLSKNYEGAIEAFSQYLKNSKSKHAEEAMYLRAESYYQIKQYKKAIIDFSKFPEKYHHSKKLPSALYRIGLSFESLGMREDAKGFYQELVDKFPKSSEARNAHSKLK